MENIALIAILVLNFLLLIIIGVFAFVIFKLLKNKNITKETLETSLHPVIKERIDHAKLELRKIESEQIHCPNHPSEVGEGQCAICDKYFCSKCLKPFKNLHFCKEHLPLIMKNSWQEVYQLKTNTQYPEEGVALYEFKSKLWKSDKIPLYIETHYKLHLDNDDIETYLVLFSIESMSLDVKERLGTFIPGP